MLGFWRCLTKCDFAFLTEMYQVKVVVVVSLPTPYPPPAPYQVIAEALNQLVPPKANLVLLSGANEGKCDLKEKWFGTQYSMEGKIF